MRILPKCAQDMWNKTPTKIIKAIPLLTPSLRTVVLEEFCPLGQHPASAQLSCVNNDVQFIYEM